MKEKFKLPDVYTWDGYNDWITDLSWIPNQKIGLIIKDYELFLDKDLGEKKFEMDAFKNIILPFWDTDVLKFVVEGKTRVFNVYMVD